MKLGIFGGTFNPVHKGHMSFCLQCKEILGLDKLLLVPTNIPPHKCVVGMASNADRLAMLQIAAADYDFIEVSDIEFQLSGISYTYNTLLEIKKVYSDADMFLIIGSDMLTIFNKWHRYRDILKEVTVVVGAREVGQFESLMQFKAEKLANSPNISIVNISESPMSSTEIRRLIGENKPVGNYLNSAVENYIKSRKLYNESDVEINDKVGL